MAESSSPESGEVRRGLNGLVLVRFFRPPLAPPDSGGEFYFLTQEGNLGGGSEIHGKIFGGFGFYLYLCHGIY